MKKTLLFLACIIGLLTTSCSQDDDFAAGATDINNNSQQVRWYGVKNVDAPQTRGVAQRNKLWSNGTVLTVKLLNDPFNAAEKVETYAKEWEQYANIKFDFVGASEEADIRIGFDWNDEAKAITWSYTGNDAKRIINQNEATLNIAYWDELSQEEQRADVLRAFGQVLGLELEHRHLGSGVEFTSRIKTYWDGQIEDISWDELKTYVLDPINTRNLVQTEEYDEASIMIWPFTSRYASGAASDYNYNLSETDKQFIGTLYPKAQSNLPTIQEAWVDAGFFEWTDATKTALRITKLGAEQETLPNVSDGQQLTSAKGMFRLGYSLSTPEKVPFDEEVPYDLILKLKEAPMFNTSNVKDFSRMFWGGRDIISIPNYDTSNGTDFSEMFSGCYDLLEVPPLNTSKGINFSKMFDMNIRYAYTHVNSHNSFTKIPLLDTSNGTNFSEMFSHCRALTEVPLLDTSKGTDFSQMFQHCVNLTQIPLLDSSKGTNFSGMFQYCEALLEVPLLNTANGTDFSFMFFQSVNLEKIHSFNTSQGTDFSYMFGGCRSLREMPLFNTKNGTNFAGILGQTQLNSIPHIDTSKGIDFSDMFYLTSYSFEQIPLFDTRNGTDFSRMFYGNNNITEIPAFNTSKGTNFYQMLYNCNGLEKKPNLDLTNATDTYQMYTGTPFAK